jgi:hypothetical protein
VTTGGAAGLTLAETVVKPKVVELIGLPEYTAQRAGPIEKNSEVGGCRN